MSDSKCVFCKFIEDYHLDKCNLDVVYESGRVLAFYSTKPYAEVHIMIVSKQHIATIFDMTKDDDELKLDMLDAIKIASEIIIKKKGACKIEMYLGEFQQVRHLHCHVIYDSSID